MNDRRLVRVRVARHHLVHFIKNGVKGDIRVVDGIPEDAIFSYAFTENIRGDVSFVFQHESFDPVPEGAEIPEAKVLFERIYPEEVDDE